MLLSTKPVTAAEKAIICRSRQLTDFKWTPLRDIPTYTKKLGNTVLPEGEVVTGFPYASEEYNDKFICENVSFESFLSAVSNPHSKLYQPGHGEKNAPNYGIVCNGLVRYAYGIRNRVSTKHWYTIPGMVEYKHHGEYSACDIKLCDILYAFGEGRNHVALITDILKNEKGEIVEIEVSEACRPTCKRASYSTEVFFEKYSLFSLCRYGLMDEVQPFDEKSTDLLWNSAIDKNTPKVTVDNGNRSNYLEGDEVVISVFSDEVDTLEILCNGDLKEEINVGARAFIPRTFSRGHYTARLKNRGDIVEFCVNSPSIDHSIKDGLITVKADPRDEKSRILYLDFRIEGRRYSALSKYEELTEEEKSSGSITRMIPDDGKNYKVYFENEYGIWTHPMISIF